MPYERRGKTGAFQPIDPAITEICRKIRIIDYLKDRGVELKKSGRNMKCCCPLPDHADDDTPSFNIRTMPDGVEMFKCFGCGKAGNILTLMHLMTGEKPRTIRERLAAMTGVSLLHFNDFAKTEPLNAEILEIFCEEDEISVQISQIALAFMQANCTRDAINKVSRLYEAVDKMADLGDAKALKACYNKLGETIRRYQCQMNGKNC
jgi:DNA primase